MIRRLFFIAALEKFAANGVRAMLVVYYISQVKMAPADALHKTAVVLALNYLLPLFVGWVLDTFVFLRTHLKSACIGLSLASFAPIIFDAQSFDFYIAVILVMTSVFRATLPEMIKNNLGPQSEAVAFTKMYTAFNWGTTLGTLFVAILGEVHGWQFAFVATMTSLFISSLLLPGKVVINGTLATALAVLAALATATYSFITFNSDTALVIPVLMAAALAYLYKYQHRHQIGKNVFFGYLFLMVAHVFFFAIYEQASTSFIALALNKLKALPESVPTTALQLFDPVLNVILGSFFALFWGLNRTKNLSNDFHMRFALGFAATVPALYVLSLATESTSLAEFLAVFGIATCLFVVAEQFIVPAGFSATLAFSKGKSNAKLIGIWYLSVAFSETVAGHIGAFLTKDLESGVFSYQSGTLLLAALCIGFAVFSFGWSQFQKCVACRIESLNIHQ